MKADDRGAWYQEDPPMGDRIRLSYEMARDEDWS